MLTDIAESLEKSFRPLAVEKDLAFVVERSAGLPASIRTDQQRLDQILRNLLANAFKFTQSGSVTLKIARVDSTADHQSIGLAAIAFSVIDTGIGIDADKQQLIFEAFQQADGSTSRNYGGTGLGLSICRELARALGGKIQVRSTPAEGSTFTLYLPDSHQQQLSEEIDTPAAAGGKAARAAVDSPAAVFEDVRQSHAFAGKGRNADAVPLDAGAIADRKALVVDDDPRNLYAMRVLLERYKMEVLQADNGLDALELIAQHPGVAIVLMDIMMPGMDGFETIRRIRTELNRSELPVIAVTAKAFPEDRERCIQAGASDYLAKPIDESRLITLIAASLGN